MEREINGVNYHAEVLNPEKSKTMVLLHGFTGSTETWRAISAEFQEYKIVLVDLIGHGQSGSPEGAARYSMEMQVRDLDSLFEELGLSRFVLAGYSMGGRTALAYACTYSGRVGVLVLESASPGLKNAAEQQERRARDEKLAERILADGVLEFVDFWEKIPLFDSQKMLSDAKRKMIRAERLQQKPLGLANSLIGMGTGSQASYWEDLARLDFPVLLVTGSLDEKFCAIAERMAERLPNAEHRVIEAGHAIHVEKPAEFATMVKEYLSSYYRGGKS